MRIVYNGIDLFVIKTHEYAMESIYDPTGTDYLYTRHTIVVRAIVNGQVEVFQGTNVRGQFVQNGPAITYTRNPNYNIGPTAGPLGTPEGQIPNVGPPVDGNYRRPNYNPNFAVPPIPGQLGEMGITNALAADDKNSAYAVVASPNQPVKTMDAIRFRLSTPRGRLFISAKAPSGESPTQSMDLISPGYRDRCDCKNGPTPKILNVVEAYGDATTLVIDFAVETYVNEGEKNGVKNPGVMLSNRWSGTHEIDERSFTTIHVEGDAIFRTDLIYKLQVSPDSLRPTLFMPIPLGFVREGIVVTGLPDVTGVHYSYQDKQVPVNFVAGSYVGAARISAVHRQAVINSADVLQGALQVYERVLGIKAQRNFANLRDSPKRPRRGPGVNPSNAKTPPPPPPPTP